VKKRDPFHASKNSTLEAMSDKNDFIAENVFYGLYTRLLVLLTLMLIYKSLFAGKIGSSTKTQHINTNKYK